MANNLAAAQVAFRKAADELQAEINKLQRFPKEFPVGTVLVFTKSYPDEAAFQVGRDDIMRSYDYAALRTDAGWYTTAQRGGQFSGCLDWAKLVELIGDSPAWLYIMEQEIPIVSAGRAEFTSVSEAETPALLDLINDPENLQRKIKSILDSDKRSRRTTTNSTQRILALLDIDPKAGE